MNALVRRLHEAQQRTTEQIAGSLSYDDLPRKGAAGFTVNEILRMWVWHFWSHHRDLVRARGCIEGDNPHFHVPHFARQAHEEFGRFVGCQENGAQWLVVHPHRPATTTAASKSKPSGSCACAMTPTGRRPTRRQRASGLFPSGISRPIG